ncbi:MAG: VCBS repeat-containing protein, partial [Planctomycetota bacterium]
GDGRGGFDRGATLPNTLFFPRALTDVDGDGDLDVVAEFPSARARIGFYDGVAGFTVVELPGSPSTAITTVAAVDLDGDGTEDVLTIAGNEIVVLMSDGTGGYAVADRHVVPAIETLAVGDFDEDGRADVVAVGNSALHYLHNELGTPRGITAYGTGTATCRGTIGMTGDRAPVVGSSSFRVVCSNAPTNAAGLLLVGTRRTSGIEVPGLQLVLHLGVAWPLAAMHSDVSGSASVALPLPPQPWLAGLSVHVQSIWMADASSGDTCSRAVMELASSRGLSITLQR